MPHWSMDLGRKLPEELHILEAGHRFEVERILEAAHMPAVVGRILTGHEFNCLVCQSLTYRHHIHLIVARGTNDH